MNCICLKMRLENECCRGKRLQVWDTNLNKNKCYKNRFFGAKIVTFLFLSLISLFWRENCHYFDNLFFHENCFYFGYENRYFHDFWRENCHSFYLKKGNIFGVKIVIILGTKIVIFTILVRKLLLSEFWNV